MIKNKGLSSVLPYFFLVAIIMFRFLFQGGLFFNDYTPYYELIFIYSWSFIAHFHWDIVVLALIGLFRDLLFIDIFGVSMISFVVFAILSNSQMERIEKRGFLLIWLYFIVIICLVLMLRLLIVAFFTEDFSSTMVILSLKEGYFSTILYPLFYSMFLFPFRNSFTKV